MIASRVPGRDGDPLDDAGPLRADRVGPRPHRPAGEVPQPVAQEVDQQARLLAGALAVLDVVEPHPEPEDDGLGLPPVDAEGPATAARAGLAGVHSNRMKWGPTIAPLGFPDRVAGVVPAVGNAVAVGVLLQVVHRRGPGPLDLRLLGRDGRGAAGRPPGRRAQTAQRQQPARPREGSFTSVTLLASSVLIRRGSWAWPRPARASAGGGPDPRPARGPPRLRASAPALPSGPCRSWARRASA